MTTHSTEYRRRSSSRSRSPRGRRNNSSDRTARPNDDDYYRRNRPSSSDKRASSHHRSKPEKVKEEEEERLTEAEKEKLRQASKRECRVYVGNLAYTTRSADLKKFLSDAGTVVYADVLMNPNGFSKGCGIVEFSTAEAAQKAITDYSEKSFMGRPIFIREDREEEATIGLNKSTGKQVFVANLPYTIGWQDLKDFFRNAGNVVRADVMMFPDRQSKGVGTVSFETTEDVQNAISMYDGYEWQGRKLEVREDKFPQASGGFPSRTPQRFAPYPRPMTGGRYGAPPYYGNGGYGNGPYDGGYRDAYGGGGGRGYYGEPYYGEGYGMMRGGPPRGRNSESNGLQIYVGNLPYSTTMQDLKDLFRSCGNIAYAEALMLQTGKPKGCGIVKFDAYESVERACAKFHGYVYGGRPLEVRPDRYM